MFPIDIRTTYLSIVLINIINLILMILTYFQIKKRFPGTLLILLSFLMSATGNILVFLRTVIPDWLSIPVGNTLIVSSCLVLFIGMEKFVAKRSVQIHNYIVILLFFVVHSYFTFENPSLYYRLLNLSVAYVFLSSQISYLMLQRISSSMRPFTRKIGVIFAVISCIQFYRIINLLQHPHKGNNFFKGDTVDSLFLLSWQIIVIFLAYSISLMYNKRLIMDINTQEEKFSKAFHASPSIILLSTLADGKIFEINKSVETIAGYKPKDLIGHKALDLQLWDKDIDRENFISTLLKNKLVIDQEYAFKKKNGDFFNGLINAEVININNEQCIIAAINDISSRKEAEDMLIKSQNTLRELNATKDKFLSIIAHDLRSPFNGIIGFTELLKDQVQAKDYDGILEYAEIINNSSNHAMDLLSKLLEWTRSQTGRIAFQPKLVHIDKIVHETVALLQSLIDQKGITVSLNINIKTEQFVDKSMIEAILRNLISNAIKFTPNKGKIKIYGVENDAECIVSIADSGIGISELDQSKLFKIDSSYSTPGTNNEGGTGLGLILCKDFIDYHQGRIWVESEVGLGTTFSFSIPIKEKN